MNYELFIENPKSDIEKKISGTIKITDIGFEKKAIGELSGFTDGFTIGPITKSDRKITRTNSILIEEIIAIMIIEVQFRYSTDISMRLKSRDLIEKPLDNTENESLKITESVVKKEEVKLNIFEVLIKVDENGRITNDKLGNLKIIEKINENFDEFANGLQSQFDVGGVSAVTPLMFEQGREIILRIKTWDTWEYDLESEDFGDDELSSLIENWVTDNTVQGRFSTTDATENMMLFEQVRIPLYDEKGKAVDARKWANGLRKYLKDTYQIESKLMTKGLGQAQLVLGEK